MELKGKNCVVTGASSGIGFEVVKKLLQEGAIVLGVANNYDTCKRDFFHQNLHIYNCDISKKQNVDNLFEYAIKLLGSIDLFYANAGFTYCEKIENPDWNHIENIFQTNVFSPIYSLEKLKAIKKEEESFFLMTASGMSFISLPKYALYSATKAAIHKFSESYSFQLAKNQKLAVVYPISTKTNFFEKANTKNVPWPVQDVEVVAEKVVKGIKKNKNKIFPSKLFAFSLVLFTLFPFAKKKYLIGCNTL